MKLELNNINSFSDLITKVGISIPLIQRDYVQGREHDESKFKGQDKIEKIQGILKKYTEEKEKRDAFVSKLIEALSKPEDAPMRLTFIYGKQEEVTKNSDMHDWAFIPLDGQQRLTSLSLLSWVLLRRLPSEDIEHIKGHNSYDDFIKGLNSFTYKTRPSSNAFCSQLFSNILYPNGSKLSDQIEEEPWFDDSWIQDPSVQNMLYMLDFIDNKVMDRDDVATMVSNLLGGKGVTFELLDMESLSLTDGLYIQMNGRGKQLTPFENWKSGMFKMLEEEPHLKDQVYTGKLNEKVKEYFGKETITLKEYFAFSIERQWVDTYWKYCVTEIEYNDRLYGTSEYNENCYPVVDDYFMNIFATLHQIFYYTEKGGGDNVPLFHDTVKTRENTFSKLSNVSDLFAYLDILYIISTRDDFFSELFFVSDSNQFINSDYKVRLFDGNSVNLLDRCANNEHSTNIAQFLLFAILRYIKETETYEVTSEMKSFVRQIRNLLENESFLRTDDAAMTNTLKINQAQKVDKRISELINEAKEGKILNITPSHAEIEDFDFCYGNPKSKFLPVSNNEPPINDLSIWAELYRAFDCLDEYSQISLLLAYGYRGHYILSCGHGYTYLLGGKERWKTIFMDDHKDTDNITEIMDVIYNDFSDDIRKGMPGTNVLRQMIEVKKQEVNPFGFAYYVLKYQDIIYAHAKGKKSTMYFSINRDADCMDMCAVMFSGQPVRGYHTDPIVYATKENLYKANASVDEKTLYVAYSTMGIGRATLDIYETNERDANKPIAVFEHVTGLHGEGGWKYFDDEDHQKFYPDDIDCDRILAGTKLIKSFFPNCSFAEKR